jgi:hypothetical protein
MFKDHLSTRAYKQLSKEEASELNQKTRTGINVTMHRGCRSNKAVLTYFQQSTKKPTRDAKVYDLPKLNKDPIVDITIINIINSIPEGISKISDYYRKKITSHMPTHHLRDPHSLVNIISDI